MAVIHPLESRMQQTKSRAKRIILVVWLVPCLVAAPFLYPSEAFDNILESDYGVITRLTCFITLPDIFRRGYYTFLFVFIYCLPLSFIAGTCVQVARCLLKDIPVHRQGSIRRQEANRRKVAKMVLMVVVAFAVAWTPYFLVSIITQYQRVNFMERENYFFTMLNINLFAFLNSCVNPFIYAAMSTRFRNGLLRFFRYFCLMGLCSGDTDGDGMTTLNPVVAGKGRGPHNLTFKCQVPMSCLVTQSSSDSGSGMHSDTSQRTIYTVDANHRSGNSFFRSFFKKPPSRRLIVHYTQKNGNVGMSNKASCHLQFLRKRSSEDRLCPEPSPRWRSKSRCGGKNCSSEGDISLLDKSYEDTSVKKCLSCLDMNNHKKEFTF